jgi:P4 family phage/plasmid primase-like protien
MTRTIWPTSLRIEDRNLFKRFKIPASLVSAANVQRVTDVEARRRGLRAPKRSSLAGLMFPYRSMETGEQISFRVRRDKPEMKNGKPDGKYMCPKGGPRGLYFPPDAAVKLEDRTMPIVLVEAEKSCLALTAWADRRARKILPVTIGGCWGWMQSNGEGKKSGPLTDLDVCNGRTVIILLDANVATNEQVQAARNALTVELIKRECIILIATLPPKEGVNGPDDLIALTDGDDLIGAVLDSAVPPVIVEYSEDSLGLRFTDKHGNDLRYVAKWGKWLKWDDRRWKTDDTDHVYDKARIICRDAASECRAKGSKHRIASAKTVAAVERLARADRQHAATVEQWDADPWLLNTPNGVVDLRTGRLRAAEREDYCTKATKTTLGDECPLWLNFLNQITDGDKSIQEYLQRLCGYTLTGDTSEQALVFLYGTGANGKSVFLGTISGILGDYARCAPIETFTATRNENHPTDIAGLQGARLVTATETEEGRPWAESKIKQMTGGDRITARFMRGDFFEFVPQWKLIIAGNHRPSLRTVDEAMRRRMNLVPFTVTIPPEKRDKALAKKLKLEWPGILKWAVEGCLAWQKVGLYPPRIVIEATEEYLASEDNVGLWLDERTVRDVNAKTTPTELYEDYRLWATAKNVYQGNVKKLSQSLLERGYENGKGHGGSRFFKGIRLAAEGRREAAVPLAIPHGALQRKYTQKPTTVRPAAVRRPPVGKGRRYAPRTEGNLK